MAIRIYLDPGHNPGPVNAGAAVARAQEEAINYLVASELADLLRADERFAVRISRPTPESVVGHSLATSLSERVRSANDWQANYFISIHANFNTNAAIHGAEMYVYERGTQAEYLAQHLLRHVVQSTGIADNGIHVNASLYVLRNTKMPAVLAELGYL